MKVRTTQTSQNQQESSTQAGMQLSAAVPTRPAQGSEFPLQHPREDATHQGGVDFKRSRTEAPFPSCISLGTGTVESAFHPL